MVLPLLGILGLGAALAAKPRYEAWAEDTATRRRAQRMQGLDPGALGGLLGRGEDPEGFNPDLYTAYSTGRAGPVDPNISPFVYNAELIRSGLLAPETLTDTHGLANIQGGYGLAQTAMGEAGAWDRAVLGETGATERARAAEAAAWNRAVLGEGGATERARIGEGGALWRQQESDRAAMERLQYGEDTAMDRLRYGEGAAMERLRYEVENRPREPLFSYGDDPQGFAEEVDKYNRYDQALASADEAWRYVNDTILEGAVWNNATRERLSAQLRTSALPAIAQDIMQAGAMSDDERPVFEKLAAVDLQGWGDSQVRAALEALIDRATEMQTSRFGTFVNSDVGGGASGDALAARLGAFGIRPPRQTRFYRRRRDERELEYVPEFTGGR
jgi:hypothetical protein